MRKYWAVTKASLQTTFAYRGPMLIWLLGNTISAIVMISVWQTSSGENLIGGYQRSELITYYVVSLFLSWLVLWYPFDNLFKQIMSGEIVLSTLMKPASGFVSFFFGEIGWHIVSSVVGLITSFILFYFFQSSVSLSVSLVNVCFIVLALMMAILVTFALSFDMALLAFWFTNAGAIESFFWMGRSVLGGATIPISFLPFWAKNLVIFLPFRYMFSFPLEILFNKVSLIEMFQGLLIGTIWIVFLYYLYHYLWEKGRRIYSAFGQ